MKLFKRKVFETPVSEENLHNPLPIDVAAACWRLNNSLRSLIRSEFGIRHDESPWQESKKFYVALIPPIEPDGS